uniref:Aldehyde dehydrogenase n=1 Tax=Octactis speculum TaxID=3111310 RepID=A0A7S2GK63_9STRA|mmetsp:Transcript_49117/g.66941  ORF Transcript_49117/g.66941 Transcript_49117/m.66941 type:complete len:494 (+) Transcript_49117:113-1594(+)|eukprot:CAMPEP_0185791290 /NCGR_PEP_ID=MMETSP1174-20130828/158287_1 /TAXON_ID=35687 /ORGANISM="Dictyocha speculum, Strain CCMP1381" /LENGTH=493 /DNA_ID=CAMNT_0028486221 /DNA_START=3115 /DNA_END=4596 /DNA_ORIENTATION=-
MGNLCTANEEGRPALPSSSAPETSSTPLDEKVRTAFNAQREFFATGKTRDLAWRKEQIQLLMQAVMANKDKFSEAQAKDGVCPSDFTGASGLVAGSAMYYLANIDRWAANKELNDTISPERTNGIDCDWVRVMEPKGVVLNIAPWNAPALLSVLPCLGALAAGNCCVIKPSETTPATAALLREVIAEKMSPSVMTVVEGGPTVSEGLIDLGFDHIMFTGGPAIAKLVMARAAKTLTPVTLELGGKNPVLVDEMDDDMLKAAVTEIIGTKAAFSGQFCQCHDIVLVMDSMWDKFIAALEAGIAALKERRMARLVNARQFERVKRMLENHKGKAVPAVPEYDADKLCIPVTAIVEPAADDEVMLEEVFGPLWCVLRTKSIDDAIAFANRIPTGKPLVSYYYGASQEHADSWQGRTSSGCLAINCGPMRLQSNFEAAIHGVGNSGMGGASLWGEHVFNTFSHAKFAVRTKFNEKTQPAFAGSIWSGPPGTYKPASL